MIVREHINFERGLDPKKAMGIGAGPFAYIDIFEKTLDTIPDLVWKKHIPTNKTFIMWKCSINMIHDITVYNVYLLEPSSEDNHIGWFCGDIGSEEDHKDPFYILDQLKKIAFKPTII